MYWMLVWHAAANVICSCISHLTATLCSLYKVKGEIYYDCCKLCQIQHVYCCQRLLVHSQLPAFSFWLVHSLRSVFQAGKCWNAWQVMRKSPSGNVNKVHWMILSKKLDKNGVTDQGSASGRYWFSSFCANTERSHENIEIFNKAVNQWLDGIFTVHSDLQNAYWLLNIFCTKTAFCHFLNWSHVVGIMLFYTCEFVCIVSMNHLRKLKITGFKFSNYAMSFHCPCSKNWKNYSTSK